MSEESANPKRYDVMAAGHLCLDMFPSFSDTSAETVGELFRPGGLVNANELCFSTGGAVSNTGIAMKKLSNKVCLCACVGDDHLGKLTVELLGRYVSADGIKILKGTGSSYTIVLAPPRIDRMFIHNPGPNDVFGADDIDNELVKQCRLFHFGYPTLMKRFYEDEGAELEEMFKKVKSSGAVTSCDTTLPDPSSESGRAPWRKILEKTLLYVDIFMPSIEEALYMMCPDRYLEMKSGKGDIIESLGADDISELAKQVLGMGSSIVLLKLGSRGMYVRTGDTGFLTEKGMGGNWSGRELWIPAFVPEKFESATGAGDAAIAGFLTAMLRGLPIEEALRYGCCCAMQNVTVLDAVSGIRSWEETTAMLEKDMQVIDADISGSGWSRLEGSDVWGGPADGSSCS